MCAEIVEETGEGSALIRLQGSELQVVQQYSPTLWHFGRENDCALRSALRNCEDHRDKRNAQCEAQCELRTCRPSSVDLNRPSVESRSGIHHSRTRSFVPTPLHTAAFPSISFTVSSRSSRYCRSFHKRYRHDPSHTCAFTAGCCPPPERWLL
jgi:hypothetical protein